MQLQADDYQIAALFGLIILFSICERMWPAHRVDHFRELKLDVLSFAFALGVNRVATLCVLGTVGDGTPSFLVSAAWLQSLPGIGTVLAWCVQSGQDTLAWLQSLPGVVKIIMAIVTADFVIYWIHRAQHRYGLLWRTHAWHHSIEEMYWFAGFRTSFFHSLLNNIPQVIIPVTILHLSPAEAGIGYSIGIFIQFVEHTNWKLSFGPLNWLLVTPDYHRIHHAATLHRGKNLAGTFRIWDKMFGTYVNPATAEKDFALGLGEAVDKKKIPRMLAGV